MMLKLTMNPRRRSKRHRRQLPNRLRLPSSNGNGPNGMDIDTTEGDNHDDNDQDIKMMLCEEMEDTTAEELADNIRAMVQQELGGSYNCADYLSMNTTAWQQSVYQLLRKQPCGVAVGPPSEGERSPTSVRQSSSFQTEKTHMKASTAPAATNNSRIDEYCREQIVEWSFRVVDYFRIDREVVAVSLSFLDRFLAKCRCDRTSFKLAATTTLHLAVKLLYPCKLADLGILSDLSRGEFDMADVCEMEEHILRCLSWMLHPPTAIGFCCFFLDYFFYCRNNSCGPYSQKNCNAPTLPKLSFADCDDIYDVASFFSELAVCDYYFVTQKSSTVALAAILNALEGMFGPDNPWAQEVLNTLLPLLDEPKHQQQQRHKQQQCQVSRRKHYHHPSQPRANNNGSRHHHHFPSSSSLSCSSASSSSATVSPVPFMAQTNYQQPADLVAARNRLWELYERSEECALHTEHCNQAQRAAAAAAEEDGHGNIFVKKTTLSPVSVTKPCHSASAALGCDTRHSSGNATTFSQAGHVLPPQPVAHHSTNMQNHFSSNPHAHLVHANHYAPSGKLRNGSW